VQSLAGYDRFEMVAAMALLYPVTIRLVLLILDDDIIAHPPPWANL